MSDLQDENQPPNTEPPAWPTSMPANASPGAVWPPPPTNYYAQPSYGPLFLSPTPPARWAVGFLIASLVLDLTTAVAELAMTGKSLDIGLTVVIGCLDILQGVVAIPCAVFFLLWVYRVCSNAFELAPQQLTITPGWTIGYFFIPILNLFRPYQAMQETWRASMPGLDLRHDPPSWTRTAGGVIVGWWWAGWLSYNIVSLGFALASYSEGYAYNRSGLPAVIDLLHAVTTVVAIRLVKSLTTRQEEAARGWGSVEQSR
jgi:hypothetical protein